MEGPPPRRIAISGIAGYLGRGLAAQLDVDDGTQHVLGIDIAPYTPPSKKIEFVQKSITEPLGDVLAEHKIDAAVHLAFVLNPMRDRAAEERVNIEGTRQFLDSCSKAKVKTVLVLSSATAYGAHPDNPVVLYEGAPLRAKPEFPYAHDKVRVEELCYEFARANPDTVVTIVRPCVVIGPNVSNFISRMLDKSIIFTGRGNDPPIQLVHEDDAVRAIFRLLKFRKIGVFNLAADGALTIGRMAQLAGRRRVRLPSFMLRRLMSMAWNMGWTSISEAPPGYLDYALHPWCVSNVKLKTELLFVFKYDALRAFKDFLAARDAKLGKPRPPQPETVDLEDEELDELEEIVESTKEPPPRVANATTEAPTPAEGTPAFGTSPAPTPEPAPAPAPGPEKAEAKVEEKPPAPGA